jgi:hypothetical protein
VNEGEIKNCRGNKKIVGECRGNKVVGEIKKLQGK